MHGKMRAEPEPQSGVVKPEESIPTRSAIRYDYLTGRISCNELPSTYLDTYLWKLLLAQSALADRKADIPVAPVLSIRKPSRKRRKSHDKFH